MRTIPLIADELLVELVSRIRPVMKFAGETYEIEPVDPRRVAFTGNPKLRGSPIDMSALEVLPVVHTYHDWGYYGLFKPSIAEVLTQIQGLPDYKQAAYFWLDTASVQRPGLGLLHAPDKYNRDGYYRAEVTFYKRKQGQNDQQRARDGDPDAQGEREASRPLGQPAHHRRGDQ